MSRYTEETKAEAFRRIKEIQERYRLEVEPFIKIIAEIQAMEPPAPVFLDMAVLSDGQRKQWLDHLKASGVPFDEGK